MKKLRLLTQAQRDELLQEWSLCGPGEQKPILEDFHRLHKGEYNQNDFLQYLQDRFESDRSWKRSGPS